MVNKWKNSTMAKEKIITNIRDRRGGVTTDPPDIQE